MNISLEFLLIAVGLAALVFGSWYYQQRHKKTSSGDAPLYVKDILAKARAGKLDPFLGREDEIERTMHIVLRRMKNNPLLIGQPGVGKTAIVEGLANKMADGSAPQGILGKALLELDFVGLMSETKYRGEMEKRLRSLMKYLESFNGNVILFIDEIHLLEEIGSSEGALSITDVLKPALARGEIQVIGATTWSEYEKYIKPDQALDRRLQPVLVDEPSSDQALEILQGLRSVYEEFHNVVISDAALKAAVELSDKKIEERYLPDKAIDLIDEASAKVSIEASRAHKVPLGVVHAASHGDKAKVGVKDIESVVDQWVIHSKEDKKRDARQDD
ncbi:ATP-dependent Clp protease ATP-binding subunit [Candidatus Uhrbacteria bacterium]|jgi:ATP-dependent Clp protease ATP-binding subunit ClpA|nr:ATP-dependent Clp protease ATP-binding subunit [Candidatus Uhrbacteria bacterium]MBT7716859.1 ATP-dependent Clp protease ATP-binding subunit [Candidatus Uhrbacteria bacterium]